VWQLTANASLCIAANVASSTQPLTLVPCAAGNSDRSQHFLFFMTPGASPQPPAALMALGALPNAVGKCFDVTGGGGSAGQAVGLYGCSGNSNQKRRKRASPEGGGANAPPSKRARRSAREVSRAGAP
jgi:hypothetical protein